EPASLRCLLAALGYRAVIDADGERFVAGSRRRRAAFKGGRRSSRAGEAHPFAKLRVLKLACRTAARPPLPRAAGSISGYGSRAWPKVPPSRRVFAVPARSRATRTREDS